MSNSLAAAKRRRAPPDLTPTPVNKTVQQNQPNVNANGLTLPQVISIIDKRLINLESFAKNYKDSSSVSVETSDNSDITSDIILEFNSRFEILAEEIGNIKDIVLKLQTYTMDVNKTLLEERVNVFSELGNRDGSRENIKLISDDQHTSSVEIKTLLSNELESTVFSSSL